MNPIRQALENAGEDLRLAERLATSNGEDKLLSKIEKIEEQLNRLIDGNNWS